MVESKKRKYSTAFDTVIVPQFTEHFSTKLVPDTLNVFYEPDSNLLYTNFVVSKKFDVIRNINIDMAEKFQILFNNKKFDYEPEMEILVFASYMTCIRFRIYFDISKLKSTFNISFDGYTIDSSVKHLNKEYSSSGLKYRNGIVSSSDN
jgi:hypothetical protein